MITRRNASRRPSFEALESRQHFALTLPTPADPLLPPTDLPSLSRTIVEVRGRQLYVEGSYLHDTIGLVEAGGYVTVNTNGAATRVARSLVDSAVVFAKSGNDSVSAAGGLTLPLSIDGGEGNDRLGGGGANDSLFGNAGNDTLLHSAGADVYRGGAGTDVLDHGSTPGPVSVTLDLVANDGPAGDRDNVAADVEEVRGSNFADYMASSVSTGVRLVGNDGDDVLVGGVGNDSLFGGNGNDFLKGNAGNDSLDGGNGNDTLLGDIGNDAVTGQLGDDRAYGGAGADTFSAGTWTGTAGTTILSSATISGRGAGQFDWIHTDFERVVGSGGNDILRGSNSAQEIRAGAGNDTVHGNGGDDELFGDAGDDTIFGGEGRDYFYGGAGNDVLVGLGGGASDQFYGSSGNDVVWGDASPTEQAFGVSDYERRQKFTNFVSTFNNGAGLEPRGEALGNPGFGATAVRYADFSANPIFARPATMDDIRQGEVGDCWWMAAAAGVAQRNPDYLRGMIVPFGDNTFGVRLDDTFYRLDGQFPVNTSGNPVYAGLAVGGGIWSALAEKAMVLHRTIGMPHNNNQYGRLTTGYAGEGFGNFGFEDQNKVYPYWDAADLRNTFDWVNQQIAEGRAVTFLTNAVIGDSHLIDFHWYNIADTRVLPTGERQLLIRNPWGRDHRDRETRHHVGPNDGYLWMNYGDVNSSVAEWVACRTSY